LQTTNPALPTYQPYNFTSKHTDMDYLRVDGEIFSGLTLENTAYTYAYWNHTLSPNNQTQTFQDIQNNTSEGNYGPGAPNSNLNFASGVASGVKDPNNAILAYSKQNAYRVYGDILRLSQDYDFGWMSGQVRAGIWMETQATHRFKYYFDSITCFNKGVDVFDVGDIAANAACGVAYKPFAGAYTGPGGSSPFYSPPSPGNPQGKVNPKSIMVGAITGVNQQGFAKDDEHSDWNQYQPFLEWEIHPLDMEDLTITPGVKFVHWNHAVNAAVGQGNLCGVGANNTNTPNPPNPAVCPNAPGTNFQESFITRDTLPFAEINYKIEPSWSVYFEYAKGIYVPDIGTFEQTTVASQFPAPETTTNYQVGTVYYADNFTFDADLYYIPINNNYANPTPCSFDSSEQCYNVLTSAIYKGIEGEGTYAFGDELKDSWGLDLTGLSVFANGALMYSKSGGLWVATAPQFTAAGGILYVHNGWKFSLIDKIVGPQFADGAQLFKIGSYGNLTSTVGYTFQNLELDVNVDNLMDNRNVTSISSPSAASWQTNLGQYFWQSPRMFMGTVKWRY